MITKNLVIMVNGIFKTTPLAKEGDSIVCDQNKVPLVLHEGNFARLEDWKVENGVITGTKIRMYHPMFTRLFKYELLTETEEAKHNRLVVEGKRSGAV